MLIAYRNIRGGQIYELRAERPADAAPVYRHIPGLPYTLVTARDPLGALHVLAAEHLPHGWTLVPPEPAPPPPSPHPSCACHRSRDLCPLPFHRPRR